ncbi:MAG: hypothetical protein HC875_19645 [Anaerolineales bacterium]|nr:hypothetical protein [Anaerolineales bacterium]
MLRTTHHVSRITQKRFHNFNPSVRLLDGQHVAGCGNQMKVGLGNFGFDEFAVGEGGGVVGLAKKEAQRWLKSGRGEEFIGLKVGLRCAELAQENGGRLSPVEGNLDQGLN